jgi:hypothetical protein
VLVIIVEWGAFRTVLVREAPETVITPETTAADPSHLRRASAALAITVSDPRRAGWVLLDRIDLTDLDNVHLRS